MKRPATLCCVLSALVLLQTGEANAAPDEQVRMTELAEASCRSLRSSESRASGGGFSSSSSESDLPELQPMQWSVNPTTRARRQRACAEAETLRQALEWEKRPASSVEAVWDAVFVPLWSIAAAADTRANVRPKPTDLTQRYEESSSSVLRGHPPSAREALSRLAVEAVMTYRASRAALVAERICVDPMSFETGEDLGVALNGIDALIATLKEQLVDEVWDAVDPMMAAKLKAYAETAQPTVWDSSPAFFSDWSAQRLQTAIRDLCQSSRLLAR